MISPWFFPRSLTWMWLMLVKIFCYWLGSNLPYPLFWNAPLPRRSELQGVAVEISPYWNGKTLHGDPHTLSVVVASIYVNRFFQHGVLSCTDFSCVTEANVVHTMPPAIYLMLIEKRGRLKVIHSFALSIKSSDKKQHCFVAWFQRCYIGWTSKCVKMPGCHTQISYNKLAC